MRQIVQTSFFFLLFGALFSPQGWSQSCINLIGDSVSGNPGDTIEVNLSTLNFEDCLSFSTYLIWDKDVLVFHEVSHLLPVTNQNTSNNYAPGKLAFSWFSEDVTTPVSYADDTNIITMKFIVVGDVGDFTPIAFDPQTAPLLNNVFVVSPSVEEVRIQGIGGSVIIGGTPNTLELSVCENLPSNCVSSGMVDVSVSGGTFPYTYEWIGPNGFTSNKEDITNSEIGDYELTVTDSDGEERIALLYFDELVVANCSSDCVSLIGAPVSANPTDTIEVKFSTLNFTDYTGVDLFIEWDEAVLEYHELSAPLLTACASCPYDVNLLTTNLLQLTWASESSNPVSFPDDSELLRLRFIVNGAIGTETHVKIKTAQSSFGKEGGIQKFQSINAPVSIGNAPSTFDLLACNTALVDCGNDGVLSLNVAGATPPYTFYWTGPNGFVSTNEDISNDLAGAYAVTVTDQAGKEQTADLYIDSTSRLGFFATLDYECLYQGKSNITAKVEVGPEQDYTFDWGNSTTTNSYFSTLKNVSTSNNYSVSITGENNCQSVVGPVNPSCITSHDYPSCFLIHTPQVKLDGGQNCIPVYATGISQINVLDFSMDWPGLQHFDSLVVNPNLAGNIVFYALDSSELVNGKLGFKSNLSFNGSAPNDLLLFNVCVNTNTFTDSLSEISFAGDSPVKPSVRVEGVELGFRYVNGEVIQTSEPVFPWDIRLRCVSITSCMPLTASIDVQSLGVPVFSLDYLWTGPNGFQATTESIPEQELAPGFYKLTATRASDNASRTAGFEIRPREIASEGHFISNVKCAGSATGSIAVFHSDYFGLNYAWSNGAVDTSFIDNLPAGTYTVTVTNQLGCELIEEFVVNEPSAIAVDPIIECSSTGETNGRIDLQPSGGIGPYVFTWADDNMINSSQRDTLSAGTYQVTISDAASCTLELNNLLVPDGADLELIRDSTHLCLGDSINLFNSFPANATLTSLFPMEGVSCNPCIPPFNISPTENTSYVVTMEEQGCTYFDSTFIIIVDSCVWPGDTDLSKFVDHFDLLNIGLGHGTSGPLRPNASTAWMGQTSSNWMQSTPTSNVNYKHLDTDGNGLIEDLDTIAITQNWGEMHSLTDGFDSRHPILPYATFSAGGVPFYVEVDSLVENMMYNLPVILGVDAVPLVDVYGVAFSLVYDPEIVVPGSASLSFGNSWIGGLSDLLHIQRTKIVDGQVDIAVTRRDRMGQSGFGQIASFNITIEDDIFFTGGNGNNFHTANKEVVFEIKDVRIITHKEEEILAAPTSTTAEIITGTVENWLEQQIKIYPNPADSEFLIQSPLVQMDLLSLYNTAGEKIKEWKIQDRSLTVSCDDLAEGVYWLRIATEQGVAVERLMILH